ncbi:MAG TPA: class I SAM-dependent methyltransferase [Gammaproteobacteria bacterium]|nr:class I SAM-dependent methyltransferase [Gammaproteobacteria bacterium]
MLREFKSRYAGRFSILEFGTSDGYSFTKILYAARYLGMQDRVTCHAFDTFVGMPAPQGDQDRDLVGGDTWVEGQFAGRYDDLERYCASRYENYRLHKGLFQDTLTPALLASLRESPPILIWVDCDFYSSARSALQTLVACIPNGCVIYFDEYEQLNFGSRFTGEAKLVHEINHGLFGDDVELVPDTELSMNTKRIYRFIRYRSDVQYTSVARENGQNMVRYRSNDSPLP